MYLEEQNSDLNDEINDLICLSNDLTSLEDRLAVKLKGWNLIPESKINFVALLIAIHQNIYRLIFVFCLLLHKVLYLPAQNSSYLHHRQLVQK